MPTPSSPAQPVTNRTFRRRAALLGMGLLILTIACCGFVYRIFLECNPGLPRDLQFGCLFAPLPSAPVLQLPGASPLTQDSYLYENPVWSPDGQTIAVMRNTVNQTPHGPMPRGWELVLLKVDTKEMQVIDLGDDVQMPKTADPTWSPDGRYLAFMAIVERIPPTPPQIFPTDVYNLIVFSVADGSWQKIDCPYCDWLLRWLTDGSLLGVAGTDTGSNNLRVVNINPETGEVLSDRPILNVNDLYVSVNDMQLSTSEFVVSIDGQRLLVSMHDRARCSGIWKYAGDLKELTPFIDSPDKHECDPAWSWDGSKLAYTLKDANVSAPSAAPSHLIIANADGSEAQAWLRPNLAFYQIRYPAWSPDGTRMVFAYGVFRLTHPSYSTLYIADVPPHLQPNSSSALR